MSKIIVLKKNITRFDVDCVVNAANSNLLFGGGVCGAIFQAAGHSALTKACDEIGHCDTGNAVITPAFNIKNNKYIIHAVGPIYSLSRKQQCRDELYSAYKRSLEVMVENKCSSIVFPLISSGIYGYPIEEAWKVAIKACNTFIAQHKDLNISIFFAVLDDERYNIGTSIIKETLSKVINYPDIKLYEAVRKLHEFGYEKVRLMSYYSPSGCYFRTVISTRSNFDRTGFVCDDTKKDKCILYSDSAGFEYFGEKEGSFENLPEEEVARKILEINPFIKLDGKGSDSEYADWFKTVIQYARNGIFPYAFSEYGYNIYDSEKLKLTNGEWIEFPPSGDEKEASFL